MGTITIAGSGATGTNSDGGVGGGIAVKDHFFLEGEDYFPTSGGSSLSIATGSINQSMGAFTIPFNRAFYVESMIVSANFYAQVQVGLALNGSLSSANYPVPTLSVNPNQSLVVPINRIIRQVEGSSSPSSGLNIRKLRNADGTDATVAITSTGYVSASLIGRIIYDDLNFKANKIILFVGDSVFNGAGRTAKTAMYDWKIRMFYANAGINVRGVMKAVSGATSANLETFRQNGMYDVPQADLIIYEPMINDAGQSLSTASYTANLNAFIVYKQKHYPNAKMLVLGCHPQQVALTESNAVPMRAAASAAVITAADPNIFFYDLGGLGSAFSSVNANYASTDGVGTGVHPSNAGDTLIYSGNGGSFIGIAAFLAANIPTI